MKTTELLILAMVISLNTVFGQGDILDDDTQTEKKPCLELPRIQVIPIKDTMAERQYELYIKLPEGYSENNDIKYPVIYFTDAMWHVEILSGSVEYVAEKAILVGISWQKDMDEDLKKELGPHTSRFRDYSLIASSNPENQAKYQFGQASSHLIFIRNDVIKYIENNYRTDPDNRTYFGYSMGGTFGAYILLEQPDTFRNYILGSPSLRGISEIESDTALNRRNLNANVFISVGSLEEKYIGPIDDFVARLKNKNDPSLLLKHVVIESADHSRAFPMTAVRSIYWLSDFIKE